MALVTGSHGLSGRAVHEHLHGRPGWEVIGASRRAEPTVAGAPHFAVNLADRAATHDALARCVPTNLFFGAYIGDTTSPARPRRTGRFSSTRSMPWPRRTRPSGTS